METELPSWVGWVLTIIVVLQTATCFGLLAQEAKLNTMHGILLKLRYPDDEEP